MNYFKRISLFLSILILISPATLHAQNTQPLTGSCAGIINTNNLYSALIEISSNSIDSEGNSLAIKLNFDNLKIELINNQFVTNSIPYRTKITSGSSTFTMTESKRMSGAKTIIFSTPQDNGTTFTLDFTLIPVNSNNSFLIQGGNVGFTGICQKI